MTTMDMTNYSQAELEAHTYCSAFPLLVRLWTSASLSPRVPYYN